MTTKLTTASGATGAKRVCQPAKDCRNEDPKGYKPLMRNPRKSGTGIKAGGASSKKRMARIYAGQRASDTASSRICCAQVQLDAIQVELCFLKCAFSVLRTTKPSKVRLQRIGNLQRHVTDLREKLALLAA